MHAEALDAIDRGSNFHTNAIRRLEAQRKSCEGLYRAGVTGKIFLQQTGMPDWAQALKNRSGRQEQETRHDTMRDLVKYGFFTELLITSVSAITDEESLASYRGFNDGVEFLLGKLQTLISEKSEHGPHPTFDWYIETRGFHQDQAILGYDEKRHAAMKDVADMLVASLSYNSLRSGFREVDNKIKGEKVIDGGEVELAENYPLEDIHRALMDIGYVDGLNRVFSNLSYLETPHVDQIRDMSKKEGLLFFRESRIGPTEPEAIEQFKRCGYPATFSVGVCVFEDDIYLSIPDITGKQGFTALQDLKFEDCGGTEPDDIRRLKNEVLNSIVGSTLHLFSKAERIPASAQSSYDGMKAAFAEASSTEPKPTEQQRQAAKSVHRAARTLGLVEGLTSWVKRQISGNDDGVA